MFSQARTKRELRRAERRAAQGTTQQQLPDVSPLFTVFCTETLGVELSPGQRVFAKVAFDNWEPCDLIGEERQLARDIFGPDVERIPAEQRATIALVAGARGGKTSRLGAYKLVHAMFVRDLSSLAPGQRAVALAVAPNDDLRQEIVNYAIGVIRASPLAPSLVLPRGTKADAQVSRFACRRNDGHIVSFRCAVATKGGYGGRGRSLVEFLMDEACFFRGAGAQVNDSEIYRAASARVLPGGQSLVYSTPWAETGLLYELFAQCWNKVGELPALVAHAPTLTFNASQAAMVKREMARDPENAEREFGAVFMSGGSLVFFDVATLEKALALACPITSPSQLLPGDVVAAGLDCGFRSDSSTLAIVVRRGNAYYLVALEERRPKPGAPLKPSETLAEFASICVRWSVEYVVADGHYLETVREHTTRHKLRLVPAPSSKERPYVRSRNLLREERVKLPNNPRLVQQLKEVRSKAMAGGGLSITHPRWATGGHGDLAEATVIALDQAGGHVVPRPPKGEEDKWRERRIKEAMEDEAA